MHEESGHMVRLSNLPATHLPVLGLPNNMQGVPELNK